MNNAPLTLTSLTTDLDALMAKVAEVKELIITINGDLDAKGDTLLLNDADADAFAAMAAERGHSLEATLDAIRWSDGGFDTLLTTLGLFVEEDESSAADDDEFAILARLT